MGKASRRKSERRSILDQPAVRWPNSHVRIIPKDILADDGSSIHFAPIPTLRELRRNAEEMLSETQLTTQ